jgi:hypothetical protein
MTTRELEREETCVARLRASPAGAIDLVQGDDGGSVYGPVEIAWYADRMTVTAVGAGPASITRVRTGGDAAQDVVVEIRLPRLDELTEVLPGAD